MYGSVCVSDSRKSDCTSTVFVSGSGSGCGSSSGAISGSTGAKRTSGGWAFMNGMMGRRKYLYRLCPETMRSSREPFMSSRARGTGLSTATAEAAVAEAAPKAELFVPPSCELLAAISPGAERYMAVCVMVCDMPAARC